jgi:hypothetical protein
MSYRTLLRWKERNRQSLEKVGWGLVTELFMSIPITGARHNPKFPGRPFAIASLSNATAWRRKVNQSKSPSRIAFHSSSDGIGRSEQQQLSKDAFSRRDSRKIAILWSFARSRSAIDQKPALCGTFPLQKFRKLGNQKESGF